MKAILYSSLIALTAGAAAAQDWSGPYAGIQAGVNNNGSWEHFFTGDTVPFNTGDYDTGSSYGGFAGVNFQSGSLVYGGEIAFTKNDFRFATYPDEGIDNALRVSGRAGYAFGNSLAYAHVGFARTGYMVPDPTYNLTGVAYGVGIDHMFTDKIFGGAAVTFWDVSGPLHGGTVDTEHNWTTIDLRIGYKF
ncbi:outer membrane protein [Aliiroseovarius sp. PrR006]|uniref:outer membrane protein n=1 Tax=Aliiroseovarius sp. PrR006 TaxID=2706883 RepID=UPI0013D636BC|nr:outer membrane beta-barrel protein [Aliiroseovarius sp. PrR006]NDW52868.1 outer membrane beta-barrel protein [Aliiroseovarius sp. PrR006]